jgi:membrane protein implicated in regulation of membrane protease activity
MSSNPPPAAALPLRCSWEEFRLYFETTEKVIDRRLSLNTWNYGICLATIGACGVLANWAVSSGGLRLVVLVGIALLSGMGALLCWFWIHQLKDLKLLNNSKFSVLEQMAPLINFANGESSYEPFRREWDILSRQGATTKRGRLRIAVLKSSGAEFLLPIVFMTIFCLIAFLVVALCFSNSTSLMKDTLVIPAGNTQELKK